MATDADDDDDDDPTNSTNGGGIRKYFNASINYNVYYISFASRGISFPTQNI